MFFNQCQTCNERWEAGTTSTCKCPPLPDYRFNMKDAPIKYQIGKAVSTDWVMRITPDRKIEVAEDVEVTEAAKKVLEAIHQLLDIPRQPWVGLTLNELDAFANSSMNRQALCCAIEAKLKEKNGSTPPRQPLTDEERREIAFRWRDGNGTASEIIDMVEAAHCITPLKSLRDMTEADFDEAHGIKGEA
jgi:hypothetical protein